MIHFRIKSFKKSNNFWKFILSALSSLPPQLAPSYIFSSSFNSIKNCSKILLKSIYSKSGISNNFV